KKLEVKKPSCAGALVLRSDSTPEDKVEDEPFKVTMDIDSSPKDNRPVASTPVPGSPWCVVWTGDDRVFFFNPTMQLSVWEKPVDLKDRGDLNKIIEDPPHKRKKDSLEDGSNSPSADDDEDDDDDEEDHISKSKRNKYVPCYPIRSERLEEPMDCVASGEEDGGERCRTPNQMVLPLELRITHFRDMLLERGDDCTYHHINVTKDCLSWSHSEWQQVIFSDESRFCLGGDDDEGFVVTHHMSRRPGVTPPPPLPHHLQELYEDIQAAWDGLSQDTIRNLYSSIPRRLVSAFSTWEKELHKIVFDPRYLLLGPEERKQIFDQFVKARIKEEHKERKSKLQHAKEEFRKLLEESKITARSTFKEFSEKYGRDPRFKQVLKQKDQELLFSQFVSGLKKRDKENRMRLRKMR
ncbi:hypothetical protein NFI96_014770, partial [Prochilodus magdalenae]